jgi:hypothetical protein
VSCFDHIPGILYALANVPVFMCSLEKCLLDEELVLEDMDKFLGFDP